MKPVFLAFILAGAAAFAGAAEPAAANEEQAIRAVVGDYLHGLKFNDVAGLQRAFWSGANLFWVKKSGSSGS